MFLNPKAPRRRHLALKRAEKVVAFRRRVAKTKAGVFFAAEPPSTAPEDILVFPGEEVLFSYYRPSLYAGAYSISVTQDIIVPNSGGSKTLKSAKNFRVVGARFQLEEGDVVGKYPPQGHGDYANILPHVILGDPHLPWSRLGKKEGGTDERNSVPWLALLVFTQDELAVGQDILGEKELDPTGGVDGMAFSEIFALQRGHKITSPFSETDPEPIKPDDKAKFIFVPGAIFSSLFSGYDDKGVPVPGSPDTDRYRYLAHVRKINTEGLPDNINGGEDDSKLFSLVVAHRTPPLGLVETTSIAVHLVSIEGVESVVKYPLSADRVALVSLHSWTYSCLPAGEMSLQDRMKYLGDNVNVLRPSQAIVDAVGGSSPSATLDRVKQRAKDGFTLVRYRVQTGEETIAFTRSPFVPGNVPYPIPNLVGQSLSSGVDLQILDQTLGIMDITYASAWQLGKTLAIADRAFTSALVRIRTAVARESIGKAKMAVTKASTAYLTLEDTLKGLAAATKSASALPTRHLANVEGVAPQPTAAPGGASRRWRKPKKELIDLSIKNEAIRSRLPNYCDEAVRTLAASQDGNGTFYAEYNEPASPDWMLVFKWILDKHYMYNIPPHYLLPEPEILPNESLRFFAIDKSWMDALIDGALSVANHQTPELDQATRNAIKKRIEEYLNTVDPELNYKPQVPTHGMILRSDIVAQFPGLTVRAPILDAEDYRAPILRQDVICDGTMLCLFDRAPGSEGFKTVTLQMPPHEQRFSVAESISTDDIKISYKSVYTDGTPPNGSYPELRGGTVTWKAGENSAENPAVFDWESRTLVLKTYNNTALEKLLAGMPNNFKDEVASATLTGIQLNDPMYEMTIGLSNNRSKSGEGGFDPISMAFGPQSHMLRTGFFENLQTSSAQADSRSNPTAFGPQSRMLRTGVFDNSKRFTAGDPVDPWDARYKYGIWPVDAFTSTPTGNHESPYPIPNDLTYPIDLVFSAVRLKDAKPRNLKAIKMTITMTTSAGLMTEYHGPGGYMVSNMRWTFAIFENLPNERLTIGAVPRDDSANSSPVEHNSEISFVLRECSINPLNSPPIKWNFQVVEEYEEEPFPGPAIFYQLMPKAVIVP